MRIPLLCVTLTVMGLDAVGHAQAQSSMLLAPTERTRVVTMSRDGAVLASVTVPPDTFVFVVHDGPSPTTIAGVRRWEFHGDVELFAQPSATVDRAERLTTAMRKAAIRLAGEDVDTLLVEQ